MMRLMRRSNSETDSTSTRLEIKRLLFLLLGVAAAVSVVWFALTVVGSAVSGNGNGPGEAILRAVGFGSVLIAGWTVAFVFALAFRRDWLSRYNLWLASAALVIAAIGALSFLSPSEGLLGWFALGGEITPGGRLGDLIIGSQGWTGLLRVCAALAVAGALFALPAFQSAWDALASSFGRRREAAPAPFAAGTQFSEDEDSGNGVPAVAPLSVMGTSSSRSGFAGNPSSWYANSEPVWAREASRVRPRADLDAPSADPDSPRTSEIFDLGISPIRSAPVPSLANYIGGMKGSDSVEARIRRELSAPPPPEPDPVVSAPQSDDDGPFGPLNLNKLPEPVFALSPEPEPTIGEAEADAPTVSASEAPVAEEAATAVAEEIEDRFERDEDPAEEFMDDNDPDFDDPYGGTANGSQSVSELERGDPVTVSSNGPDSGSVVISDSGHNDFFMSQLDSTPLVVESEDQKSFGEANMTTGSDSLDLALDGPDPDDNLMSDPSSDHGDFLMPDVDSLTDDEAVGAPRGEDGSDSGDSLSNLGSVSMVVDLNDQPTFDDSVIETTSMSADEPETVLIQDAGFDPDPPAPEPPATSSKANKYWAIDSGQPESEQPPSLAFDRGEEAGASPVVTPVTPAWRKPSIRILDTAPSNSITEEEQRVTADAITRTLAEYGIEVGLEDIRPGPTVTMYGLTPGWVRKNKTVKQVDDSGMPLKDERGRLVTKQVEEKTRVKVDSILAREKDLSLALKTPSIRLETPAMGKSLIGIEVPNPNPSLVTLRSIMESAEFRELRGDGAHLPVALGQGSGGEPVVFDLAKMPHLLVAGATGSGKSVCLNAIVSCLITEKTPAEMRMILVDPKRVELTPYNGIPHLLAPVIVETDTVVGYLKGLIREMFDRYRRMEEVGVRNIEAYNGRMPDKMPFLCVVIDELADLMMTAAVDVEQSICRLAQLGRATGIHMIIATQRPSVDVLTGLIKANFPSRISFGVTSQVDSRTILDTGGADKLLGRGDMLYLPLDASKPSRVQSVFIGDSEIGRLVDFWQSAPRLPLEEIDLLGGGEEEVEDAPEVDDPDRDEMIDKAIELALSHRKLSTSLLQRRLRIGYPRAARLMDQLEEEGIVGPGDGSRSRDVIINQN